MLGDRAQNDCYFLTLQMIALQYYCPTDSARTVYRLIPFYVWTRRVHHRKWTEVMAILKMSSRQVRDARGTLETYPTRKCMPGSPGSYRDALPIGCWMLLGGGGQIWMRKWNNHQLRRRGTFMENLWIYSMWFTTCAMNGTSIHDILSG